MKTLFTFIFLIFSNVLFCQGADQENLEKYWKYRDQLRKRFMKIGQNDGESIPASVIIPHRQYGQTDQSTGRILQWRDATITLGYYWIVLATEYKLLSENNQDVQATLNELYYAMQAFNRLDMKAEGYLGGDMNAPLVTSDLNGFFIRDDVRHQIAQNFENDPPFMNGPIQPDPGRPNQMRADFEGWTNYDDGTEGNEVQTTEPHLPNSESLDQLTTILLGLRFIEHLVPNTFVKPTEDDSGFYIHDECLAMIKRIVEYLNDTDPNNFGQYSAKEWTLLQGEDETVHNGGSSCILQSYPMTEMMKALFSQQESEMIGEPGEVRWQFRAGDICIDVGNGNGQGFDDSAFAQAVVNAVVFAVGNFVLGQIITGDNTVSLLAAAQGAVWAAANCGTDFCCEAVDGPLIIEVPNETIRKIWERMESSNIPMHAEGSGTHVIYTGDMVIKIDGIPNSLPQFTPIPIGEKLTNDDNVHIMLEQSLLGNIWGPTYVADCAYPSHLDHIPLLNDILHFNSVPTSNNKPQEHYQNLLTLAPCVGPWADPENLYNSAPEWSSANRLFHSGDRNMGANKDGLSPDDEYRGYFPGIDYMLMYNAYHIAYQSQLPEYKMDQTCTCTESITSHEEIWFPLEVKRKFPDYKAKGIPIGSYLTSDLTATSTDAIIDVKNDLIICSPVEGDIIELTLLDGARMNLYNGNSITVKKGNKLLLRDGAILFAGIEDTSIPDDNTSYSAPEIFLEENAEMIIENYSSIKIEDGLRVHLKEGSVFRMKDSNCTSTDLGITFDSDGGEIIIIRSNVVSRSNYSQGTNLKNTNLTIEKSNLTIRANGTNFWLTENCNIDINSNSTFHLNTLLNMNGGVISNSTNSSLVLKHGYLDLYNDAKMYWNDGRCELLETDSRIKFDDSEFHIAPYITFEPTHDNVPSGYLEFSNSYDVNFFTGTKSIFSLIGDSNEDLMLKINNYANLWNASTGDGDIIFEKCKVDLTDHAGIWIGQRFRATEVDFMDDIASDILGGNIHVWYNDCTAKKSKFENVKITGHDSKMEFQNSKFMNQNSGIEARGGSYKIDRSNFYYCHVESFSLEIASQITNSSFSGCDYASPGMYSNDQPQVYDESSVEVKVVSSNFLDAKTAVVKYGGKLSLACNTFQNMTIEGVKIYAGYLAMSSASGGGFNTFLNVRTCIELVAAESLDLYNGYNYLAGYTTYCIHGTLNKICINSCESDVVAFKNYWGQPTFSYPPTVQGSGLYTPDMSTVAIEVYGMSGPEYCYQIICTSGCPGCKINFKDPTPSWSECRVGRLEVRPLRSQVVANTFDSSMKQSAMSNMHGYLKDESYEIGNPPIYTPTFDGVTLDSALVYAAMQMEQFDSLASDLNAVTLFNEILSSPLDRTNADIRWRMEWGRYNMKSALENLFLQSELNENNNTEIFELPVQQYVDVLNLMTDSLLTDSTYKEQFYLEIDKGQLFRTLGNPEMARYIYQHLDDCDLDSLEQSRLNNWLSEVDIEIRIREQYLLEQISPDSIDYSVDSTSYTSPIPSENNDFYFGLWINSPQSVTFASCGNQGYKSYRVISNGFRVFPNPTSDEYFISVAKEGSYAIKITDLTGRLVFDQTRYFESNTPIIFNSHYLLSGGQYVVSLTDENSTLIQKLIVN